LAFRHPRYRKAQAARSAECWDAVKKGVVVDGAMLALVMREVKHENAKGVFFPKAPIVSTLA
jgi:hypothetical protein